MPPSDGSLSGPGRRSAQDRLDRVRHTYSQAPAPLRVLIVVVCCVIGFPVALVLSPYAIISGSRSIWATGSVTIVGLLEVSILAHGDAGPRLTLLLLPVVVAFVAHAGALGRRRVPCRTLAWTLLLGLLPGAVVFRYLDSGKSFIGPGLAWLLALIVIGWRLAKAWQDSRNGGQAEQVRGGGPMPPRTWAPGQPGQPGQPGGRGAPAAGLGPGQSPRPGPGTGLHGGFGGAAGYPPGAAGAGVGGQGPRTRPLPNGRPLTDQDGRMVTGARAGRANPNGPVQGQGPGIGLTALRISR